MMQRLRDAVGSVVGQARRLIGRSGAPAADTGDAARNYDDEREATRLGGMSEEDRAWETASQKRSEAADTGDAPPPERD